MFSNLEELSIDKSLVNYENLLVYEVEPKIIKISIEMSKSWLTLFLIRQKEKLNIIMM